MVISSLGQGLMLLTMSGREVLPGYGSASLPLFTLKSGEWHKGGGLGIG